jgi:transposase-like protein
MKSTRYRCPVCDNTVTLHVTTSRPPTCTNPNMHSSRSVEMIEDKPQQKADNK